MKSLDSSATTQPVSVPSVTAGGTLSGVVQSDSYPQVFWYTAPTGERLNWTAPSSVAARAREQFAAMAARNQCAVEWEA